MTWNRRTTRRDRKRRNTHRCRSWLGCHVVHFGDAVRLTDYLADRAIRWPVRCVVCKRIIHRSPIISWMDVLRGKIHVMPEPTARTVTKFWYDFTTGQNVPITGHQSETIRVLEPQDHPPRP